MKARYAVFVIALLLRIPTKMMEKMLSFVSVAAIAGCTVSVQAFQTLLFNIYQTLITLFVRLLPFIKSSCTIAKLQETLAQLTSKLSVAGVSSSLPMQNASINLPTTTAAKSIEANKSKSTMVHSEKNLMLRYME